MGPRRAALRCATAAQHETLESIFGPIETLSDYGRYLLFLTAFRSEVETKLHQMFRFHPVPYLPLQDALAADCRDLGLAIPSPCGILDLSDHEDEYLGALYVLEGSRLGAAVIREKAHRLQLSGDFGARHLDILTDGCSWPNFLSYLETATSMDEEALIAGARKTFSFALEVASGAIHVEHC